MRLIPRYGVRGATQTVVGSMWLGPAVVGMFVGIPLTSTANPSPARAAIGWIFVGFLVVCLFLSFFRVISSFRVIRQQRQDP